MTEADADAREWTLAELAEKIGGHANGNTDKVVTRVAELQNATSDAISHCSSQDQARYLENTQAGIVILCEEHLSAYSGNSIVADQPRLAFAHALELLHPGAASTPDIHPSAVVGTDCVISESASIAPNVVIGANVEIGSKVSIGAGSVIESHTKIGAHSTIGPNATIYRRTTVGKRCRFSAQVVLGAPGFSFERNGDTWTPVRNIGALVIGDDVDIGALTSIDRGSIGDTRIHDGVKIDNNCHIGHNVEIGKNTLIVASVGIGGGATIGQRCVIGGMVAIRDNVSIADDVTVLGTSMVSKSIAKAGTYSSAVPARDVNQWNRTLAKLNNLNP